MKDIYSKEKLKEHRKKNFEQAKHDLKDKNNYIMKKIEKLAKRYDMNKNELYKNIIDSPDEKLKDLFIAENLAIDPKRQNIYENIFLEHMENNNREIIKLPRRGLNAIYLTEKELILGDLNIPEDIELDITNPLTFIETINNEDYYYYHQHTESKTGGGGAQRNKYEVIKKFVIFAREYCKNNKNNKKFVALVDGTYYNYNRKNKLKKLAGEFSDNRIFIISTNEVLQTIK